MKGTGFVRKIDELGRIVIPKEFRRSKGWDEGSSLEILMDEEGIYLRKYQIGCVFCGESDTEKRYAALGEKKVCFPCFRELEQKA